MEIHMANDNELPPLTNKQEAFVDHYIASGFNGTKAAKDAGYSEKSAAVIATENLRKPNVAHSIAERKKQAAESAGFTPEYIFNRLMYWARMEDHVSSLRAIDMAAKFSGLSSEQINLHVNRHEDWLEQLMKKESD
jgi:phage terminase small subunit